MGLKTALAVLSIIAAPSLLAGQEPSPRVVKAVAVLEKMMTSMPPELKQQLLAGAWHLRGSARSHTIGATFLGIEQPPVVRFHGSSTDVASITLGSLRSSIHAAVTDPSQARPRIEAVWQAAGFGSLGTYVRVNDGIPGTNSYGYLPALFGYETSSNATFTFDAQTGDMTSLQIPSRPLGVSLPNNVLSLQELHNRARAWLAEHHPNLNFLEEVVPPDSPSRRPRWLEKTFALLASTQHPNREVYLTPQEIESLAGGQAMLVSRMRVKSGESLAGPSAKIWHVYIEAQTGRVLLAEKPR